MQSVNKLGHSQGGAVLLVGLIMVLLMTIVGLAAIRGTGMQEQMAGNMRNLNLAFQAAEAALREGEQAIEPNLNNFGTGTVGYYANLSDPDSDPPEAPALWSDNDWQGRSVAAASIGNADGLLAEAPRYVAEAVNYRCDSGSAVGWGPGSTGGRSVMHRVTSRGVGGDVNSVAILQSTYILLPCID